MQDLETKSLWSQISGECISGEMEGKKLSLVNFFHTTYNEFKMLFPDGLVLSKPVKGNDGSPYETYFADSTKLGIFGRVDNFQRLNGKNKVFGLRLSCKNIAVTKKYLTLKSYILIDCEGSTVVVNYNDNKNSVVAFIIKDDVKSVISRYEINDREIISLKDNIAWNARTGRVVRGKSTELEMVPVITAYWFAWATFFADTELIN